MLDKSALSDESAPWQMLHKSALNDKSAPWQMLDKSAPWQMLDKSAVSALSPSHPPCHTTNTTTT